MDIDLLRNRNMNSPLGPFDGEVAAMVQLGAETYFVTTNTDYIPAVPSLQLPHKLYLRSDMRYGTDDPTLWPQQFTECYCHFAAIAKKGVRRDLTSMPRTQISSSGLIALLNPVEDLITQVKDLDSTSTSSPLFGPLLQTIRIWSEQLRTLPTTYDRMVFMITLFQRAVLELDALYHYTAVYKPRMENNLTSPPEEVDIPPGVGAFTASPVVAQQMWAARLPFWFLRPSYVFDAENILAVVPIKQPMEIHSQATGDGVPRVLYSGNSTAEKIAAIHRQHLQTAWYRDPFEIPDNSSSVAPLTSTMKPSTAVASSSRSETTPSAVAFHSSSSSASNVIHTTPSAGSSSLSVSQPKAQDRRYKPYPPKSAKKAPKSKSASTGPTQTARDKFILLSIPEMPLPIAAWAEALAQVDQSVLPFTSDPADRQYVLPEPALLVNSTPERRRKFLHHWNLLSDGFFYMLSNPGYTQLLSAQEWRDILEGLLKERGNPNSKTGRRSGKLQDCIQPALDVSGVSSVEGFPIPLDSLPHFTLAQTREIVWKVAEINFRFELCSLDKRASGKDRREEVLNCVAGHVMLQVPLEMSKRGLAAMELDERVHYVLRLTKLMMDWTTRSPRPTIINSSTAHLYQSPADMQALEKAVCRYYTQSFWEYYGRAAVIPLRLDHELTTEDVEMEI
ncbi:hypothetical protein C8R43DRAFT_1131242 [Mycena crocata]|nr:hypothetical protein C8R43DRAFT_1131242 [Mycena crocata]